MIENQPRHEYYLGRIAWCMRHCCKHCLHACVRHWSLVAPCCIIPALAAVHYMDECHHRLLTGATLLALLAFQLPYEEARSAPL